MLPSIFYYYFKKTAKYFKTRKTAKIITLALFAVIFIGLAVGIYYFFLRGLEYIRSYPFFAQALTLYSYEIYLLLITLLIIISAFIASISTLFKKDENDWIMAAPAYKRLLALNFFKIFIASLWPLLVMAVPCLFAIKAVYGLSVSSMIISLFSLILLTLLIVSIIYLIVLIGGKLLNLLAGLLSKDLLNLKNLIAGALLLFTLAAGTIWYANFNTDLIDLFKAQNIDKQVVEPETISENFKLSPAHPVAAGIFSLQNDNIAKAYSLIFLLMAMTALAVGMVWMASGWYLTIWQKLQEGGFTAKPAPKTVPQKSYPRFLLNSPEAALFKKEILISSRSMRNVMWFGFFLFIWLIQTGVNLVLSKNIAEHEIAIGSFPVMIQVLQFLTAIFFISAFVLRFVFPSFSMERNTSWIIDSSPIQKQRVFWTKLSFYLPILILLGVVIGYSNLLIMDLSFTHTLSTLILFIISILFSVTLGLSLGAIFPSQDADDPAALSTSMPGIGFTLASLGHGILGAWFLFRLLKETDSLSFLLFIISTIIAVSVLFYIAPASFSKKRLVKKTIS